MNTNVVELAQKPQETYTEWNETTLRTAFDLDSTELMEKQKEKLLHVLFKYPTTLSLGDSDVGCTSILKHSINTLIEEPVNVPVRCLQGPILYEIEDVCQKL